MTDETSAHPTSRSPLRVAVIGGGLAGLAAAHRLIELSREGPTPIDVTVFEAGDRLGGVIETGRIGDYLVERAADSFITNKAWGVDLCRRLGLEDRLIPTETAFRGALVLRRGRPVPVPEGFQLMAPTRLGSMLTTPIFSTRGKLRIGLEPFLPARHDESDESLASFVRRRFGREAFERLVQPLIGGIYTGDPEKLSLHATMPQFAEMERQHGSVIRGLLTRRNSNEARWNAEVADHPPESSLRKGGREVSSSGARYGLFVAPAGGMEELIDALAARIQEGATVRLHTPVSAVALQSPRGAPRGTEERRPWSVAVESSDNRSQSETFDAVLLAVPAYRAADLLTDSAPELAESLRGIDYASTAIVITGHRLSEIAHPLNAFGLVVPAMERRNILAVSFASRKFPGRASEGRVILRTFLGGALQPELLERPDDELIDLVRGELRDLLGVTGEPDFAVLARHDRAMPQYYVGHRDRMAHVEQMLADHPGLMLAGNAYRGVGIPDVIHSGERAAEEIVEALLPQERDRHSEMLRGTTKMD